MINTAQPAPSTPATAFYQFVRLPLLGETWVERDRYRPQGRPFFAFDVERGGPEVTATGPISSLTVMAGRWTFIADRPATTCRFGLAGTVVWIALGAPLLTLVAIAGCLLASPVRRLVARPQAR